MKENARSKTYFYRQLGLATCSSLGFYATGLIRGFSSPGIPSMERISYHLVSTAEEKSWITSIPPFGAALGSLVTAPLMHYFGRKRVLQVAGPLFGLSWIGIALSDSVPLLAFSRAMTGFCAGISVPTVQVYVSEASDPAIRGLMASLPSVVMVFGLMIQYLVGLGFEWRGMAWISAIAPALMLPLISLFPESPAWLRLMNKSSAESSRKWYGLEKVAENANLVSETNENVSMGRSVFRKDVMVPFSLALAMMVFQQTCGNDVVTFNAATIFQISGSNIDKFLAGLAVGLVHFIFTFLSIFIVDRLGRRLLLLFSSVVMGLSMAAVAVYFRLHGSGNADGLGLLPLVVLLVYIAAFSLGFCTVPLILVGEIIPLAQRSILGPITTSVGLATMFIELKTYSNLTDWFGQEGAFWTYALFNLIAFIFIYFLLPETKGKSLDEIENSFKSKRRSKQ